jgi:hypothetical protein
MKRPASAPVLEELLTTVDREKFVVAIGVNDSSDRTAEIARGYDVIVSETEARGYGHGCVAAIEAVNRRAPGVGAYLFFAADGASDPRDIATLLEAHEAGHAMVLGARTTRRSNWSAMTFPHVIANVALGLWCGLLGGRWFTDLAPLRLIDRGLFEAIAPREMTFGWTIEAQIGAAMMGARICEVSARERRRLAGEQKVSGVTWRRTFSSAVEFSPLAGGPVSASAGKPRVLPMRRRGPSWPNRRAAPDPNEHFFAASPIRLARMRGGRCRLREQAAAPETRVDRALAEAGGGHGFQRRRRQCRHHLFPGGTRGVRRAIGAVGVDPRCAAAERHRVCGGVGFNRCRPAAVARRAAGAGRRRARRRGRAARSRRHGSGARTLSRGSAGDAVREHSSSGVAPAAAAPRQRSRGHDLAR